MRQYVFFAFAAIAAVAVAGFAFQMYRSNLAAPAPVLIAEVSRTLAESSEVGLPKNGVEVKPPAEARPPRPPKIESASVVAPMNSTSQTNQSDQSGEIGSPAETRSPDIESALSESNTTNQIEESPPASPPPPPPSPPPLQSPPPSVGVRVLISEIFYDAAGSDVGKEFIELYNEGDADADLNGWSLSNGDKTLVKIGSAENDRAKISARGFFLIGFNKYTGAADAVRSAALPNTSAAIALKDKDGAAMDEVSYGGDLKTEKDSDASLERRAWEGATNFSVQPNPNPRSSFAD